MAAFFPPPTLVETDHSLTSGAEVKITTSSPIHIYMASCSMNSVKTGFILHNI
jgi:hypothetical protein